MQWHYNCEWISLGSAEKSIHTLRTLYVCVCVVSILLCRDWTEFIHISLLLSIPDLPVCVSLCCYGMATLFCRLKQRKKEWKQTIYRKYLRNAHKIELLALYNYCEYMFWDAMNGRQCFFPTALSAVHTSFDIFLLLNAFARSMEICIPKRWSNIV